MKASEERRVTARVPFRHPVRVRISKFGFPEQVAEGINISAGGVLCASGSFFQEGERLELLLTLPKEIGGRRTEWHCEGHVLRVAGIDTKSRIVSVAVAFDRYRMLHDSKEEDSGSESKLAAVAALR